MTTTLLILVIIAFLLLGFVVAVALSARHQGGLATKVMGGLLRSAPGRKMAERATDKILAGDGTLSTDQLQAVLDSQPELIDKMAAEQGVSSKQARQALSQFTEMDPTRQRAIVARTQQAVDNGENDPQKIASELALGNVAGGSAARTSAEERAAAKRKEAARNRRKQAKRSRKRKK